MSIVMHYRYAFIYIAVDGKNFCQSAKATFRLMMKNPGQVAINTMVQGVLAVLRYVLFSLYVWI